MQTYAKCYADPAGADTVTPKTTDDTALKKQCFFAN